MTRSTEFGAHRDRARRLVIAAARMILPMDGSVTARTVADICAQTGVHPAAFRQLFPNDQLLLEAVHAELVQECANRLRTAVDGFTPDLGSATVMADAAEELARCAPIERTGLIVRAQRRVAALRSPSGVETVAQAEKMFTAALIEVFADLFAKLERRFEWPSDLAVRIILDTYERSFEAWLLRGGSESRFWDSAYVRTTLPSILTRVSAPK